MSAVRVRGLLIACLLGLPSCIDLPEVGPLTARGNEPVADADGGTLPDFRRLGPDAGADAGEEPWLEEPQPPAPDGGIAEGGQPDSDARMPDPPEHDAGPSCAITDSNPSKAVSFKDDVWPILSGCTCHSSAADEPFGILEANLTIDDYATLRAGGDITGSSIVVPGNACDSIMLQKLSETPPFGNRMPNMGPYLSVAERQLLADWIIEGAKNN